MINPAEGGDFHLAKTGDFGVAVDSAPASLRFSTRFAVRYGSGRGESAEGGDAQRQHQVRQAFNSPFWPFVLTSTSVGQEGIDFHWWCRSVLHWNTPSNPVDFEQREGRIDRYDGLAVRRNVAAAHAQAIFASGRRDPWAAAYEIAAKARPDLGSFAPHWVYPGDATIDRYVAPFPLSVDQGRLDKIKRDVARYRLTFGQPRQEDLLEILHDRLGADGEVPAHWRIDLTPPCTNIRTGRQPDPTPGLSVLSDLLLCEVTERTDDDAQHEDGDCRRAPTHGWSGRRALETGASPALGFAAS